MDRANKPSRVVTENVDSGTLAAVPIVKKLPSISRRFSLVRSLNVLGIVPVKELEDNSSTTKAVREPNERGMVPVSLFSANVS